MEFIQEFKLLPECRTTRNLAVLSECKFGEKFDNLVQLLTVWWATFVPLQQHSRFSERFYCNKRHFTIKIHTQNSNRIQTNVRNSSFACVNTNNNNIQIYYTKPLTHHANHGHNEFRYIIAVDFNYKFHNVCWSIEMLSVWTIYRRCWIDHTMPKLHTTNGAILSEGLSTIIWCLLHRK